LGYPIEENAQMAQRLTLLNRVAFDKGYERKRIIFVLFFRIALLDVSVSIVFNELTQFVQRKSGLIPEDRI
jgi:hypothetical protein